MIAFGKELDQIYAWIVGIVQYKSPLAIVRAIGKEAQCVFPCILGVAITQTLSPYLKVCLDTGQGACVHKGYMGVPIAISTRLQRQESDSQSRIFTHKICKELGLSAAAHSRDRENLLTLDI